MDRGKAGSGNAAFFQIIVIEISTFAGKYLNDLGSQEFHIVDAMIADEQFGFRTRFHNNQDTAVCHSIHVTAEYINQLDRTFHSHTFRHIKHETVLRQHRIQCDDTVMVAFCRFTIITGCHFRILLRKVFQATGVYSFRQMRFRHHLIVERVVHDKIEGSTQVRDIATEHVIRIDRNSQAIDIHPIVGGKSLRYICIFIIFTLYRRKTQAIEIGQCLSTRSIHHRCAMTTHQVLISGKKIDILLFGSHLTHLPFLS